MQLFNTKNKQAESNREDAFHLTSITIVIFLSLIGWGIESASSRTSKLFIPQFLTLLDSWPIIYDSSAIQVEGDVDRNQTWISQSKKINNQKSRINNYTQVEKRNFYKSVVVEPAQGSLQLNSMDSVDFEKLPVFGPVLASRTVKFRNALGGFIQVSQLKEVYGIDDDAFDKIEGWFNSDLLPVLKLCADSDSWLTLKRHPYIRIEGARMIERYRKHHVLGEIEDLSLMPQIDDSLWGGWSPYLTICSN